VRQISLKKAFLVAAVMAFGVAGSVDWSQNGGLSLSVVDSAQARVGRPLTPVSAAGVARRTTRRAVVGGAVVGGVAAACVRVLVNGRYVCRY
jgi:outer membrane lipoprotein SlyB